MIGDFNGWYVDPDFFMNRSADGNYFWIELDGLTSGEEYAFQYMVDGSIRIADP